MNSKKQKAKSKKQNLHKVLEKIVEKKNNDLKKQKKEIPLSELREFVASLGVVRDAFKNSILGAKGIALIAEIKLASPADPSFEPKVEIMDQAIAYENAGVDAVSYITEKYFFKGDVARIIKIGARVKLPILQKDFVIDKYQIYEAKIVGSSALLLIARLIDKRKLGEFVLLCKEFGIEPIVEVNDQKDLDKALLTSANIIAVNARDFSTFEVDVEKACKLIEKIPDKYIKLGFSGVKSETEVEKYKKAGAKGVLVGTSLMNAKDINSMIGRLKL